ncbi:TMV resistance protein N, partial [Mucuna pruriens]
MSDNNTPQIKYDVFVSFRGEDIRHGFLSHLTDTFERKKINAFVDDKLERGDKIWPSLIEGSFISLILFSQDYAFSCWCLEELLAILECRDKYGQIVIPVFYHVQPKNVRPQLGSYKHSFARHGRKHMTKVQLWSHALNKSTGLSGIEASKFQNDADLVKEIVNLVLKRLAKPPVISKGLGMGGFGKTTLAEEVFNKLRSEYEGCDVKIGTPNSLPEDIVRRIGCVKVLIVLDDVNNLDHVEKLLGTLDNFGSGCKIIVTTRDEQVLKANKADKTYELREFSSDKALELFNLNVFNQSDHQTDYNKLSEEMVNYGQGIPLVVKVLARLLRGKNKEEWESVLDKLKKMPPTEVYDVMKLSYDGLDRKEQQIFLDLACFFLGLHIMKWLGRLFVESRTRLWDPDDIYEALKSDKVPETVNHFRVYQSFPRPLKL